MSDLDTEKKPSRRLWIIAGVAALALHIGGVALALSNIKGDDDEALGSAGEFAVEMSSPNVEDTDLPPGPDQDASVASPALAEQKAVVKDSDLPKDKPTETENPDRVVTQNDAKKPKEDEKLAAVETSASTESVAQEATARQKLDTDRQSETSGSPNQGIGKDNQQLTKKWAAQLNAYLNLHKRYPDVKVTKAVKVRIKFALDRLGHVVSADVLDGSGDAAFDEAAIAMVHRSDPLPPPPPVVADEGLTFAMDVLFTKK